MTHTAPSAGCSNHATPYKALEVENAKRAAVHKAVQKREALLRASKQKALKAKKEQSVNLWIFLIQYIAAEPKQKGIAGPN